MQDDGIGGECITNGNSEKYTILFGKLGGKRPLSGPKCRRENCIKIEDFSLASCFMLISFLAYTLTLMIEAMFLRDIG
jgi:hypothetical protein